MDRECRKPLEMGKPEFQGDGRNEETTGGSWDGGSVGPGSWKRGFSMLLLLPVAFLQKVDPRWAGAPSSFGVQVEPGSALSKAATAFPGQPKPQNPSKGMRQMKLQSWGLGEWRQEILASKKKKKLKKNKEGMTYPCHSQSEEIQLCPSPISSRMEMTPLPSQHPKESKFIFSQVLAASHPPAWRIYHPKLASSRGTQSQGWRYWKNKGNNKMWSGKQGSSQKWIPKE